MLFIEYISKYVYTNIVKSEKHIFYTERQIVSVCKVILKNTTCEIIDKISC